MHLRGIDFGHVMNASGGRNFFGQGYWFHRFWKPFGLDYTGSTFVAKTTPLEYRAGYMPLTTFSLQPTELMPRCIKVKFFKRVVLNAVGLSSPGAHDLFERGLWQKRKDPFFISFAAIRNTVSERLKEWEQFVRLASSYLREFSAPIGLEMNLFCPNTGSHEKPVTDEICDTIDIAAYLNIPLIAKINILMPHEAALRIQDRKECDGICVSNTIPWDALSYFIDRQEWFGTTISPLHQYGGGGFSGAPMFSLVTGWIRRARESGFYKPIIGCGGIMCWQDACGMLDAGADAVQLGSVSILRPWRVKSIIRHVNGPPHAQMK